MQAFRRGVERVVGGVSHGAESTSGGYSYELVGNPALQQFLTRFEHDVVGEIQQPIRSQEALILTSNFIVEEIKRLPSNSWDRSARREALGNLDTLLDSVLQEGIIDTTDGNFNREAIRVFGSLVWRFTRFFYYYRWAKGIYMDDLISDTRKALDEHPLAQLIHDPGQEKKESQNVGKEISGKPAGQVEEDIEEHQRRPDRRENVSHPALEQRFSAFSQDSLTRARTTGVEQLQNMISSLPDNPIAIVEFADPVEEEIALIIRLCYIAARRASRIDNKIERPVWDYMENQWASFDMSKKGARQMIAMQLGSALMWGARELGDRTVFDLFEETKTRVLDFSTM